MGDGIPAPLARGLKTSNAGFALARASRSVSTFSQDIETTGFSTLILRLNIYNFGGGSGVAPLVQTVDPTTGVVSSLVAVPALTGLGLWTYAVGRGVGTFSGMSSNLQGYCSMPLSSLIRCGLVWITPNFHELDLTYELIP